ncbi:PilN domain-containing protein [Pelagicoccus sp. SDUM812003]|uniref:PilN domain-containing protein n=1 Tax=Pelagicoccus sp. SDUM812003 TaxID=3041267 RepID=UPI00280C9750|nr:PilN domain-containing protein [Pelagicoccus sp. SDUM812003]MDQ8201659.1 PilN domain-containing protein [Pelagicoccus sp. SDUM812003]
MISLKKKTADKASYRWRPNFRDYEALPDVQTVRTKVFLPVIFITIAAVFCVFILFREYGAMNTEKSIANLESEIASYQAEHDVIVSLNSDFMKIVRDLDEIDEFMSGKLVGSAFLISITSLLPEDMYLTRIEYGESKVSIEGSLNVPAEEASRIVDAFMKALEEADVAQGLLTEYKLTSMERDKSGEKIRFRIEVLPQEEKKGKKR